MLYLQKQPTVASLAEFIQAFAKRGRLDVASVLFDDSASICKAAGDVHGITSLVDTALHQAARTHAVTNMHQLLGYLSLVSAAVDMRVLACKYWHAFVLIS